MRCTCNESEIDLAPHSRRAEGLERRWKRRQFLHVTSIRPVETDYVNLFLELGPPSAPIVRSALRRASPLRASIAPEVFVEILAKGGGGGIALERMRPYLLARDPSGLRFAMVNAQKDLSYYNSMAEHTGAMRDIGQAVLNTFAEAAAKYPDRLVPELVSILAEQVRLQ